MADHEEMNDPLVCITFQTGDDYEIVVDEANARGGSVDAVIEFLTNWDFGDEDDNAATIMGHTERVDLEKQTYHEGDYGNLHYWLIADHGMRHYALYRRRLDNDKENS